MLVFVGMCCLLVVLVKSSLLATLLARKTPLRKPNRGKGIISKKLRLKSAYDIFGLFYCFTVQIVRLCCSPVLRDIQCTSNDKVY